MAKETVRRAPQPGRYAKKRTGTMAGQEMHPEDRKDMAFRGYVSAIAARGTRLAQLVQEALEIGDFVECKRVAGQLLDLVDIPKTANSVQAIWESAGCEALLNEDFNGWEDYER